MIRTIAKLCVVVAAVATLLRTTPSCAETPSYASNTGSGFSCTLTQPCTLDTAIANANLASGTGRAICLNAIDLTNSSAGLTVGNQTTEVICPQGVLGAILSSGANETLRVNGLTFSGTNNDLGTLRFFGSGTLILENCVFVDGLGTALDIEPTGPLNIVIKNSRISNNAAAILLKPAAGGSVTATFDGVTIADNTGGGIKTDSANGPVTLDIYNSTVTNNDGVGVNARAGGSLNMVSIKNSVITKNTAQGVQANGANVGVTVQTTLFDENTSGATSVVAGGHISTYGNNSIVGSSGSGFTGTASLQ
jgi:hypothetical protein